MPIPAHPSDSEEVVHRATNSTLFLADKDEARRTRTCPKAPATCTEADIEALRAHGFEDGDTWDIAEVAAMFNFTNRLASATGMIPNPEYHAMAR